LRDDGIIEFKCKKCRKTAENIDKHINIRVYKMDMILEISVENYLSIREKITLSLEATATKKLRENVSRIRDNDILKTAAIYGPNASGKTNIIKAIVFLWNMVKKSHTFNIDNLIPIVPFKLDEASISKPSRFEIIFIVKGIRYKYGFSCDEKKVIDEYLHYWPKGRLAVIFSRKKTDEFEFRTQISRQKLIEKQMTKNSLYLSRATQLGYEKTKDAYNFIVNSITVNQYVGITEAIERIRKDPLLRDRIISTLKRIDFGGIENIKTEKKKGKSSEIKFKIDKGDFSIENSKSQDVDITLVKTIHLMKSGKTAEFDLEEESDGTRKSIFMLVYIFETLEKGGAMFIDELESSLHPDICKFLVRMFNDGKNKKSQFVFTTHNTNLLDNRIFRRDQIYICSKRPNENTILESLSDYDFREESNFENIYLSGRVGGVPNIDESDA